jgi:outer membrane protein TolC
MRIKVFLVQILFLFSSHLIIPQDNDRPDSLLQNAGLKACIQYALEHQPSIRQGMVNEQIADQQIKGKLADWFPQLNLNANLQHNYKLQASVFQGNVVHFGNINTSSAEFSLTQTIFNRDVLLASSTAGDVRKQASQSLIENKINVAVNVSKAFYGALLAEDQIELVNEDIRRLEQSQKDTYYQYKSGLVDNTDYMRATIELNNALAEKKHDEEFLKSSYASLKEQMGYPMSSTLSLNYDTTQMQSDIMIDTAQSINFDNRIEYQLLQTQKSLQEANLNYYKWSFLPSLSAFGQYNFNYFNDRLSELYNKSYPTSYIGLELSFPIFQGGKRFHEIEQAKLQVDLYDYDFALLKNSLNTEYVNALANYKGELSNFLALRKNLSLAKEVYNTVELQYKSGVKTYLEVITAETDLKTTQVNYINALYQLLSSKVDLEKALGIIKY